MLLWLPGQHTDFAEPSEDRSSSLTPPFAPPFSPPIPCLPPPLTGKSVISLPARPPARALLPVPRPGPARQAPHLDGPVYEVVKDVLAHVHVHSGEGVVQDVQVGVLPRGAGAEGCGPAGKVRIVCRREGACQAPGHPWRSPRGTPSPCSWPWTAHACAGAAGHCRQREAGESLPDVATGVGVQYATPRAERLTLASADVALPHSPHLYPHTQQPLHLGSRPTCPLPPHHRPLITPPAPPGRARAPARCAASARR